ncbi:MAG: PadR family transcriptional regulator, partial [Candidatus Asgardarchaeia archaeon]
DVNSDDEEEKEEKNTKFNLTKKSSWKRKKKKKKKKIKEKKIKEIFNFSSAAVTSYVVLYKLKKEGLVTTEWQKGEDGRPDRKYYVITEKGQIAMREAKKFLNNILNTVFDKTD